MTQTISPSLALIHKIAHLFSALPQVEAVALAGSRTSTMHDASSDIDLYVYTRTDLPLAEREIIVKESGGASKASLGLPFWGLGDEWFDHVTGIEIDVVYFDTQWVENEIDRLLRSQQASLGYTTCLWHTVRNSQRLHDPHGWFQGMQTQCQQRYPDDLRCNIIALNHPVLRNVIPAYANQLKKAVQRADLVSINHRMAALLASYFDVLFAVNRVLHPGEKRLVAKALAQCESLPINMASDIEAALRASLTADPEFMTQLTWFLDHLDRWLEQEGFDPRTSRPK